MLGSLSPLRPSLWLGVVRKQLRPLPYYVQWAS